MSEFPTRRALLIMKSEPDDARVRELLREITGREPVWATSYPAALEALQSDMHDFCLVDDDLGAAEALELARRAQQNDHRAPTIFLAAETGGELEAEALRAGAVDCLPKKQLTKSLLERSIHYAFERAKLSDALRASEGRYRHIVETANEGVWLLDAERLTTYVNPRMASMLGYTIEEMLGRPLFDFMDEEARPLAEGNFERRRKGITEQHEFRFRRKDGSDLWALVSANPLLDESGEFMGALGMIADITERKRTEEALAQSECRLRAIVETEPECVKLVGKDGALLEMNPAGLAMIEAESLAQAKGRPISQIIAPAYREAFQALTERALRGEAGTLEFEIVGLKGTRRWLETHGVPLRDPRGEIIALLGVTRDITERKRVEESLRVSAEQLRHSQKMEAIGQLAGGVAHDFNNLLTAINGYSDLCLRRLDSESPLRHNIVEIRKAGDRAASLTRQLLAFSRKQMMQVKALQLNSVVADTEKMLRRLIGEDVELVTRLDPALGQVTADPGQIEQVLMNLAVNARDAMPQGGALTIETANVYLDERYACRHVAVNPGHYALISVSDNGCGMDAETRARIFEPFFTTKDVDKGTGLGLSTVYGIVKQSGGSIWVESEVGRGTTFKVYLPRIKETVEEGRAEADLTDLPTGTETVLLVEDEEIVRELAREILEMCGYQVLVAANGSEALRACREHKGEIHLILTDVIMPQMSGRQLKEALATLRPGTSVLYMSGHAEDAVIRHGAHNEGVAFIQKPFTPETLARKVRQAVDARPSGRAVPV